MTRNTKESFVQELTANRRALREIENTFQKIAFEAKNDPGWAEQIAQLELAEEHLESVRTNVTKLLEQFKREISG